MNTGEFKKCCAEEIRRLWCDVGSSPMSIIEYVGKCPKCGHFIGLTQTSEKEAKKFLERYSLKLL